MRKPILLSLIGLVFSTLLYAQSPDSLDLLPEIKKLQANLPPPPDKFRPGHVSLDSLRPQVTRTEQGFRVQLPAQGITPSPTIHAGMILQSGGFGSKQFFALDALTGARRWALNLDDDGPSSAVVSQGTVVFNTESCTIFAVELQSGKLLWSHYLGDPLMSTPSIAHGKVFTAYPATGRTARPMQSAKNWRPTHVLAAFDLASGKILWQQWIDGDIMSAPVVEGEELLFTTFPGTLYKVSQETGEFLVARASRATSAPTVSNGEILMSQRADGEDGVGEQLGAYHAEEISLKRKAYRRAAPYLDQKVQTRSMLKEQAMAYDSGNGFGQGAPESAGWRSASANIGQSNVSSLQAFQGSRILPWRSKTFATMGDELVCSDSVSGDVQWRYNLPGSLDQEGGFLATPPLLVGGKLIVASLSGAVLILDPESGKEFKRYEIGQGIRYQPVVENGWIYVTTLKGQVWAMDTGDASLTGWPTWGGDMGHRNQAK